MSKTFDKLTEEMMLINQAQFGNRQERKSANKEIQRRLDEMLKKMKDDKNFMSIYQNELAQSYIWQCLTQGMM